MPSSLNRITIIGTLCQQPELKHTGSGAAVCRLLIVTDESYTNKQTGERIEAVEWHVAILWNRRAEYAHQYMSKGNLIYVEGSKRTRTWLDSNGKTCYKVEIRTDDIKILSARGFDIPKTLPDYLLDPPAAAAPVPASTSSTPAEAPEPQNQEDPLYDEAIAFVTAQETTTTDGLHKQLKITYDRAAKLLDSMATNGIVSKETNGTRAVIKAQQ